jgi:hypothetical protein
MTGTQAVNSSASRRLQNIGVFFGRQFVIAASTARRGWIDGHGAARAPGRESRKAAGSHAERNCQTIVGSIDVPISLPRGKRTCTAYLPVLQFLRCSI